MHLFFLKGLLLGEYKVLGLKSPQHSEKESIILFINRAFVCLQLRFKVENLPTLRTLAEKKKIENEGEGRV